MDERKIIEKLVDRAPLAVIVIGVIVFIMGAAGGLPIGNPPLIVADYGWRFSLGVMGTVLILAGLALLREFNTTKAAIPSAPDKEVPKEKEIPPALKLGIKIENPREGKQENERVQVSGSYLIRPPDGEMWLFTMTPDGAHFLPKDMVVQFDAENKKWHSEIGLPKHPSAYFVDIVAAIVGKSSQAWLRYYNRVVSRMTGGIHIDGPFPEDIVECARVRIERV